MAIGKCAGCSTKHESPGEKYQDEKYGKGNRVQNKRKDGKHSCTLCSTNNEIKE